MKPISNRDVRIGLVGLGVGQHQINSFHQIQGAKVAAVADIAESIQVPPYSNKWQTVQEFASSIGAKAYADASEMIQKEDLDAVSIAVAPKPREPIVAAAAEKQLPILMEKPLAANFGHGRRLDQIAAKNNTPVMMEYPLRYHAPIQRLRELLDGPLGGAINVTAELQTAYNPPSSHWMWDPENGNGLLNECMTHLYDTICFICGEPQSVYAIGGNYKGNSTIEDSAAAAVRFKSGAHALANGGGLGAPKMNNPMYVRVYAKNGEALVTGDDWIYTSIRWATHDDNDMHVETPPKLARWDIMKPNLEHFVRCLREGRDFDCTIDAGLNALRVIHGIKASLASGDVVDVSNL